MSISMENILSRQKEFRKDYAFLIYFQAFSTPLLKKMLASFLEKKRLWKMTELRLNLIYWWD